MREAHLKNMRYAALKVFNVLNTHLSLSKDKELFTPHQQLLRVISDLFKTPTIRFVEGYQTFVDGLSKNNEALDSWCKLLGIFISELGEDGEELSIETLVNLFNSFAEINSPLSSHFKINGRPNMSQALAYMLCLIQSTEFDYLVVNKNA